MPMTEYLFPDHPYFVFGGQADGRVMKKTQDYLTNFARFQTTEAIHAVERYVFVE
jgi:hypothetical protein